MIQHHKTQEVASVIKTTNIRNNPLFLPCTREALLSQLLAQLKNVCLTAKDFNDLLLIRDLLQKNRTNEELMELLKDQSALEKALANVNLSMSCSQPSETAEVNKNMEEIAEQLFLKVAAYDSQLCAQITGMMLELDITTLKHLIDNPKELHVAVSKAREEYMKYTQGYVAPLSSLSDCDESSDSSDEDKDVIAEKLYRKLSNDYPEQAAKITGMLLDLDCKTLQRLLSSSSELEDKVQAAIAAIKEASAVS